MKVAIIDYGLGNLFSIENACRKAGYNVEITSDRKVIENSDGLILPGVGAFGDAMQNPERLHLVSPIKEFATT
jgi:glutamine amidotransferase